MTSTTLQLSDPDQQVGLRDHGAGPPVMLLHGVGMQSAAWAPQMASLGQTHRVIAVDLPGHGNSSPLPPGSTLQDYVAWCHRVTTAMRLERVSLAGHSMGALIAGGVAATYPDVIARVALLNGVYRRCETAKSAVLARAADIRAGKIDIETPLDRWFGPADGQARSQVAGWLNAVDPQGYATAYAAFAAGDATYADRLADITCPFLALTGDGDPNSTPDMSRAMAQAVPNGTATIIPGHRHMVNLTAPDVVTAHLVDWLNRLTE